VRWFDHPQVREYLRISIGTDADMRALVKGTRAILAAATSRSQ
jgi:histidinol-phosphate/aromatic aminotransferase/cobyric acid decarboxylase-like protein